MSESAMPSRISWCLFGELSGVNHFRIASNSVFLKIEMSWFKPKGFLKSVSAWDPDVGCISGKSHTVQCC